jgi:hypothetical protein
MRKEEKQENIHRLKQREKFHPNPKCKYFSKHFSPFIEVDDYQLKL